MKVMELDNAFKSKIDLLAKAIENRFAIIFHYSDGEKYVIEPFVLAYNKETDGYLLIGYKNFPIELTDKKENWMVFDVAKIIDLHSTPIRSKSSRKGFDGVKANVNKIIAAVPGYGNISG